MFDIVEGEDYFIEDKYYIINFFGLALIIDIANKIIDYRKLIVRLIEYPLFEIIVNNVFLICLKFV